nr:hypothetical protein [Tanacetum cinerariifolium]
MWCFVKTRREETDVQLLYENNFVTVIMCFERAGDKTWEILAKTMLPRGDIIAAQFLFTATSKWREKSVDEKYKDREKRHMDKDKEKEKEKDRKEREREKERVRDKEIREKDREQERTKEKEREREERDREKMPEK